MSQQQLSLSLDTVTVQANHAPPPTKAGLGLAPQVRPSGPCPAKVMIVGEFPSEDDIRKGLPFSGFTGDELRRMLQEAGLASSQCFMTTAVRVRPAGGDIDTFIASSKAAVTSNHLMVRDKMVLPVVAEGLELLKREIELCRPNVIIALGNTAMWALTGKWGVTSWRGSMMATDLPLGLDYQPKVIPAYNPRIVMAQWSWRPILVADLRRAKRMSETRELIRPDYEFIIRPSYTTAKGTLLKLLELVRLRKLPLSVDIETRAGHTACIGVAWSKREAICIPLMCVERLDGYWTLDQEHELMLLLRELLCHPNVEVVGQNFSYDAQYFQRHLMYTPRLVRDTMLAQHSCFSNLQKSLDFLSSMYCEFHLYWKDDGKDWNPSVPEDDLWRYNCIDAVVTFEVDQELQKLVDHMRLREVHDFQQQLFWPVLRTMTKGIRVDKTLRGQFAMKLQDEIAVREQWLIDHIGHPLNIKSPKQMADLFYQELGQKPLMNRKTGTVSTDEESLRKLSNKEPVLRPIIRRILELRSLGVFLSTFVSAPLDTDDRLRCSYNIAGTETYRFNSRKNAFGTGLNLQNIPKGGEDDEGLELPNVRDLFIPDPGMEFFDIDLNSADLRIVVWEADEPEMKAMLRAGLDPYTEIAKEFYGDPSITKKDPRRQTFKSFAHGTNYLGSAKGLAERLGLGVRESEKTQAWYFGKFPKIKKWQDDLKDQVAKRRMVQNIFGYRTYFFDRIEGTIFNQAAAWIPQSTVGCLINRAYVNIDRELAGKVDILLQVHDSLAGQFPIADREAIIPEIMRLAHITLPYDDPLVIPVGIKTSTKSWGACG